MLKIGLVFPQLEYGNDPAAIKDYAQTAEGLGYTHILAYDHVLGVNPGRPGGFQGPYNYQSAFHEPFVLFSFMAGVTRTIEFATGIIILPQRQTVLAAKQAAALDVLSGGRFRFGVGIGWNEAEYIGLNENFHNRGRRLEEQIQVMRMLWTQPVVNFSGRWHTIAEVGINPLPIQQPIPIWFGGQSEPALERAARMGDGWMLNFHTPEAAKPSLDLLNRSLQAEKRDPARFGMEARITYGDGNLNKILQLIEDWKKVGMTHVSINTMSSGLDKPEAHLEALRAVREAIGKEG